MKMRQKMTPPREKNMLWILSRPPISTLIMTHEVVIIDDETDTEI